jgi:hypothetical protein
VQLIDENNERVNIEMRFGFCGAFLIMALGVYIFGPRVLQLEPLIQVILLIYYCIEEN